MTYRRISPGNMIGNPFQSMPEDEFIPSMQVDRPSPPMRVGPDGGGLVDRPSPPMQPFFGMGGMQRPFWGGREGFSPQGRYGMRDRMMNHGWQMPFFGRGSRWR